VTRRAKYAFPLEDVDARRCYRNVARGSRVTADVYLRRLGAFCNHFGLTPKRLVSLGRDEIYNLLLDYVSDLEAGWARSYTKSTLKTVRSWLAHKDLELAAKIKDIKIEKSNPQKHYGGIS